MKKFNFLMVMTLLVSSCSSLKDSFSDPLSLYPTPATILFLAQESPAKLPEYPVDDKKLSAELKKFKFCGADKGINGGDVFKTLEEEAVKNMFGLNPNQIGQAGNLLTSGKFISDTMSVADVAQHTITDLPKAGISDRVPRHTLSELLGNETFRFAIIVYAHAHGIDIDEDDLMFVKKTMDSDHIDLSSLIENGKERLKEKYGTDKLNAITSGCGA